MSVRLKAHTSTVRLNCEVLEDRVTPAVAVALSGTNLLAFDTASPTVTTTTAITNIAVGETLVGIDFRAQNGLLYGLGVNATADTATLYAISTRTGVAAVVGTAGGVAFTTDGTTVVDLPDPATVGYGVDFNPAVDRFRVVAGSLNFRVNPNDGSPIDGNLNNTVTPPTGINPDGAINTGTTTVDAAAYTNNQPNNGNITTQYTLDAASNMLFIQNPPNAGTQTMVATVTLGGSTLDFTAVNGFDIPAGVNTATSGTGVTTGSAFAVLNVGGTTGLYSINLVNAQATLVGNVGNGTTAVQGFTVQNDLSGFPAIGLSADGTQLVRFNTSTPTTTTPVTISGVATGETLVGIDFRPQTGQLFGLGINATAKTGTLYRIDPQTGAATAIGTPGQIAFTTDGTTVVDLPDPATAGYGLDFNPTVDRFRVVTSSGLNFRINPNNGAPVDGNLNNTMTPPAGINPDGPINGLPMGSTGVSGAAYTNSFGQSLMGGVTTQYTLDAASNALFIQNPPNSGTQTTQVNVTLGGSPLDFTDVNGFDIPGGVRVTTSGAGASGFGIAALTVGGTTRVYRINLATGAATNLGAVGAGMVGLAGFTLADAPAGTLALSTPTLIVTEGAGSVAVTVTRTGGTSGAVAATLTTSGGTAGAADYVVGSQTVTFADGQTTATVLVGITEDMLVEGNEVFSVTLSAPMGGAVLGFTTQATVTIVDNDMPPPPPPAPVPQVFAVSGGSTVNVYNGDGSLRTSLSPYAGFTGTVSRTTGDVNGDGTEDIITGTASGADHVKVLDGVTGAEIRSFLAYGGFSGGVQVAAADVNNDGFADIITGSGPGAPSGHVKVFDGVTGAQIQSFLAFIGFNGGLTIAAGDVNNDGFADLIVGTAVAADHVKVFDGVTGAQIQSFLAYGGFPGGVDVGAGDVDNDGFIDVITGTATGASHVKAFSGQTGAEIRSFLAFPGFGGGVSVGGRDLNGDGFADILASTATAASHVKAFDGVTGAEIRSFLAFGSGFTGGVYVG